ncbi:acetylxylan esterase [Candidatus Poribacteria bacterium]|nr:acetylxylan esterase [Candidatus Poribacteria bacterium]
MEPTQNMPSRPADVRARILGTFHVPAPLPPLGLREHGHFEPTPGVVAERVSYGTQFDMRVPAIVYRPASPPAKSAPAIIVVNGHGGDKYSWYAFYTGILYSRAGAVVVTYDPTGEGERNVDRLSGTRAHDAIERPEELAPRVAGLMMTDLMQAVSYLRGRPDVDPTRIGAVGYSLGSYVVAVTGAVDDRIHACVHAGGGNLDGPDEYWDNTKPMCTATPYRALSFLGDRGAELYAMHAARGPTLVYNGMKDDVVNIPNHGEEFFRDLRARTIRRIGNGARPFDTGLDADASHRPFFVTRPVASWLRQHLRFPAWTDDSIRAMPETHIATWAAANDVDTDPYYATEEREGGTMALGADVPGIPRDDLHVYADDEWVALRNRLTHEAWRVRARALLTVASHD